MPPPTTQTVFRWTSSSSGLDGLQPFLEPVPSPGAGEVLVKVRGMALNYKDVAIKHATYPFKIKDDLIPCSDMAGEVVAIGGPATELFGHGHCPVAVGDPVLSPVSPFFLYGGVDERPEALDVPWGGSKQDGVMREYVAVPAHSLIKLPACKSSRDFVKWAATPCTVSTVWNAFYGNAPLKPGDTVLTLGTGGVSVTALVLAKAAGATTIVTSSSDEKLDFAQNQLGADYRINYKTTPDWAAEVLRITNGKGVNHIIEVGGAGTMQQSLVAAARGGLITVIGFLASSAPQEQIADMTMTTLIKSLVLRGVTCGSKQQLEEAIRFMSARGLELPIDKVFAFERDDITAALKYIESGAHIGKVCIRVG